MICSNPTVYSCLFLHLWIVSFFLLMKQTIWTKRFTKIHQMSRRNAEAETEIDFYLSHDAVLRNASLPLLRCWLSALKVALRRESAASEEKRWAHRCIWGDSGSFGWVLLQLWKTIRSEHWTLQEVHASLSLSLSLSAVSPSSVSIICPARSSRS